MGDLRKHPATWECVREFPRAGEETDDVDVAALPDPVCTSPQTTFGRTPPGVTSLLGLTTRAGHRSWKGANRLVPHREGFATTLTSTRGVAEKGRRGHNRAPGSYLERRRQAGGPVTGKSRRPLIPSPCAAYASDDSAVA